MKFGIVGSIGTCIDFGITYLCKERLKWNKFIANSCGFSLAVINNYLLNKFWTFGGGSAQWQTEFGRFLLFALIGLLLNNALIYLFNNKLQFNFYLAKAFAIICVFAWNFLTNHFFNFH